MREAGRTTFGPHLSDLAVRHTQKRDGCAGVLDRRTEGASDLHRARHAWELPAYGDGRAPLLLLDEIAAHLDRTRRAALFEEILALGAQAWMTGTDIEMFAPLAAAADLFVGRGFAPCTSLVRVIMMSFAAPSQIRAEYGAD